jgi:hypothetical protein
MEGEAHPAKRQEPTFLNFLDLRDLIALRPDAFANGFTTARIEYALGRPVGFRDEPLITDILTAAKKEKLGFRPSSTHSSPIESSQQSDDALRHYATHNYFGINANPGCRRVMSLSSVTTDSHPRSRQRSTINASDKSAP